jgi:hypothetical protein
MALLNEILPAPASSPQNLDVKLDVGRTLGLLLIALALIGGALALYLTGMPVPGAAFFALGEAVLVSGLSVVLGNREAAREAEAKLGPPQ